MRQTLFTLLCILFIRTLSAQTYEVTNLRVSAFSHNYECGTDGAFSDPEPNFRVNWRPTGGIFGALTVGIFAWISINQFGLLNMIDLPIWAELLIAIAFLDLVAQYLAHYMLHKVQWMWKFHLVHHSDTHVDVTSATRHHPGDYFCREIFALFAIFIFGIPLAYYLIYRFITVFFTYFTHANINMPRALDKAIGYIFVTPHMHKFHHHRELPWTDSNFGNIFSVWDRMFGTLTYDDPTKIVYGLDIVDESRDQDIAYQFKLPFDKTVKYKS